MSMQGYYDQVVYSSVSASQTGFKLLGGTYGLTVTATWGGGSVDLKKLSADGSTSLGKRGGYPATSISQGPT
jgi:hypothetical protein